MRRNLILTITTLLFLVGSLSAQDKSQKIDELVQKYSELGQINGAVLVSENGKVIYSKGVGLADRENNIPNNADTKFRLASITKQFTAALIMQLAEKGKLKLDGKLSEYLPYYRKDNGDKVTIHQILNHTSGIPSYTNDNKFMQEGVKNKVVVKDFVISNCSGDLEFEPGSKWNYSNSGYFILGAVIESVTGKTYEEVLKENIFNPLGMTNSGYENSDLTYENKAKGYDISLTGIVPARFIDMTIPYAAGSLYSTVNDMFLWDQALYTEKILSKESKEKMFTPYMNNYGYGWAIAEKPIETLQKKFTQHSGGIFGFNTLITRYVDDNNVIIILNNFSGSMAGSLTGGIERILYGFEPKPPRKGLAEILMKSINEKGITEAVKEFNSLKDNKTEYRLSENDMNDLGYILLQNGKAKEAIEVFKLNVTSFPESFNVYDSLGEAYMIDGDKNNAIVNYKKSIELNPDNTNGKEMLKKLEKNKHDGH